VLLMPRTVAVDFDGVIHRYSRGWHDGTIYDEPMPGALDALRTLMNDYAVVIHTTRDARQVGPWLQERGFIVTLDRALPYELVFWDRMGELLVADRKLPAVAYIDDRGIRFESWNQALADLQRHTAGG
jgi:hypothetical protein